MSEFERKVARIKRAAQRYAIARSNDNMKGGGDPEDYPAIERELRLARARLDKVIRECV